MTNIIIPEIAVLSNRDIRSIIGVMLKCFIMNAMISSPLMPALLFAFGAAGIGLGDWFVNRKLFVRPLNKSNWGIAIVTLVFLVLAVRVAFRMTDNYSAPPTVLAPWGLGDGLTVRLDGVSTPFLFVPVLLLMATFWGKQVSRHGALLVLSAGAAAVFVAANGIAFSYALLLFDLLGAIFWYSRGWRGMALARLFLSVFSVSALMFAALFPASAIGEDVFALALWLRLTLFPFVETNTWSKTTFTDAVPMVWTALSTASGVYAAARFLQQPVPVFVDVLVGVTVLFNAVLAWGSDSQRENTRIKLLRMSITQPGLILLVAPVSAGVAVALGLGYTLALGALWLMPNIGEPDLRERHWLWVYAVPILATLTIIGFPFTFGWVSHLRLFTELLQQHRLGILALVVLSEGMGFSVLVQYWRDLLAGNSKHETALWTALMVTVPFLLPGAAGVTFTVITGLPFYGFNSPMMSAIIVNLGLVWVMAFLLGIGRDIIVRRLSLSSAAMEAILQLDWLWAAIASAVQWSMYRILHFKAIFEGKHYLGWAFLLTLAGILVAILQ